jgi:hypothetical protein
MLLLAAQSLCVPADVALAQQRPGRAEVKLSEAKPLVKQYVESISKAAKEHTGIEFSEEQKTEMVNTILSKMEVQGTYAFIDP